CGFCVLFVMSFLLLVWLSYCYWALLLDLPCLLIELSFFLRYQLFVPSLDSISCGMEYRQSNQATHVQSHLGKYFALLYGGDKIWPARSLKEDFLWDAPFDFAPTLRNLLRFFQAGELLLAQQVRSDVAEPAISLEREFTDNLQIDYFEVSRVI